MSKPTLLLPCAATSMQFPGVRPQWMLTTPDSMLAVQRAAQSIRTHSVERTVIGICADHESKCGAGDAIRRAFSQGAETVIIDAETSGPGETCALLIEQACVRGPILIKDPDNFFEPDETPSGSFIAICDLRQNLGLSRVGAKSFVTFDERGSVKGVAENDVVSNFVSAGLYGFSDASIFTKSFQAVADGDRPGDISVSTIITDALQKGEEFNPFFVSGLVDIGTPSDWRAYSAKRQLLIIDIDGVVFQNQSEFFPPYWGDPMIPIRTTVDHLLERQRGGAQLLFVTARPEKFREPTLSALGELGLAVHALVMGCVQSTRVLINDQTGNNLYAAASGVIDSVDARVFARTAS